MRLSKNFTLEELLKSPTAEVQKFHEQNNPDADIKQNLLDLVTYCLQPLRDALGAPIISTSCYRCLRVNNFVGGSKNSYHMLGMAMDFTTPNMTVEGLYQFIRQSGIPFTELIQEYSQWIHIAYDKNDLKGECLRAVKQSGITRYIPDGFIKFADKTIT